MADNAATHTVYTAILEPEADGRHSVHLPALPGVHSYGTTRAEALGNVVEAADLWIEVEQEMGHSIPENGLLQVIASLSKIIADQAADGLDPPYEERPVIGWIKGDTYDHYEEHLGWIEQILAKETR
jgi:predicted RNase H-like HicB family nuclease